MSVGGPAMSKLLLGGRIAISSIAGVCCLLMIAWWVRSYSWQDGGFVKLLPREYLQFSAADGRMCVWFEHKPINIWFKRWSRPLTEPTPPDAEDRIPWFDLAFWPTFARLYTAHWLLAVLAGLCALAPWCPTRFNLRTMLGGITVIGAITSLIIWVDRTF